MYLLDVVDGPLYTSRRERNLSCITCASTSRQRGARSNNGRLTVTPDLLDEMLIYVLRYGGGASDGEVLDENIFVY